MIQHLADMKIEIDDSLANVKVESSPETLAKLRESSDSKFFMDFHIMGDAAFIQTIGVTDVFQITSAISEARFD